MKVKDCRSTSYKTWGPWEEENRKYVGNAAIMFCPVRNLLVKTFASWNYNIFPSDLEMIELKCVVSGINPMNLNVLAHHSLLQ